MSDNDMAETAYQLDQQEETEIAQQHDKYLDDISSLNDIEQRNALIQKVHEINRALYLMRKQNRQLQEQLKQKAELLNVVTSKLTDQAQSFTELANNIRQGSVSTSTSTTSINNLSMIAARPTSNQQPFQSTQPLISFSSSAQTFAEFESMLRSTQQEIDSQFAARSTTLPHHQPTTKSAQHGISFYDVDGALTRRGRAMVGSIFSMFASNGQSMTFDELTRLYQAAGLKSLKSQPDELKSADDDDELLWCVWQSHASSNDNDDASLSEEDLATVYVQEKEFDLDQHARTFGLIGN